MSRVSTGGLIFTQTHSCLGSEKSSLGLCFATVGGLLLTHLLMTHLGFGSEDTGQALQHDLLRQKFERNRSIWSQKVLPELGKQEDRGRLQQSR